MDHVIVVIKLQPALETNVIGIVVNIPHRIEVNQQSSDELIDRCVRVLGPEPREFFMPFHRLCVTKITNRIHFDGAGVESA